MDVEQGLGIPGKCPCGAVTIILTSKTQDNPGRRFYRCGAIFGDNHLFKWADEAHQEELETMSGKLSVVQNDLIEVKENILELKNDISEIVKVVGCLSNKIRK